MEPAGKRAKLEARNVKLLMLGKKSFVSRRGLDALLRTVKRKGLPSAFSRATQYRARKAVCSTLTPYGKLVQEPASGTATEVTVDTQEQALALDAVDLSFQGPRVLTPKTRKPRT